MNIKLKRTCIPISWVCNSRCIFCMDDWSLSEFVTIDDIKRKLVSARKYSTEVTFSSLEPTLHPKLNQIVKLAKDMWFLGIEIITNWRKLKNFEFVHDLIISWLNKINISIHSYNEIKHDFIVWSSWAFKESIIGLLNVCKLSKKYNLKKTISVTVCKQNYKDIVRIVYFLEKFYPDNIIINILQPKNIANENKSLTFIKYSLMIKEFLKLNELQKLYKNIYINWLSFCLEKKLNNIIWYFNWAEVNFKNDDWDYIVEFNSFKEKREECKYCKYFNICDWVWKSYIDKFWWEEFNPVR